MPGDQDITSEHPSVVLAKTGGVPLALRYAVRTDTGLVRDHNEDDFLVLPELGVYLVADGMGGHNAGSVASRICIETVDEYFSQLPDDADEDIFEDDIVGPDARLTEALILANRAIFDAASKNPELAGMGTTVVGVLQKQDILSVCHAGDSRVYLFRNGDLRQLTLDHSLGNFLRALGREGEARLAENTMSNVIMRALGLEPMVEIESSMVTIRVGDRLLLCSDGLSDLVSDDRISAVLMDPDLKRWEATERLVELALDEGGRDNITALLVDVYERGAAPEDDDPASFRGTRFDPESE